MRVGFTQASQFVYSQHCKAARRFKITEAQIAAIPSWSVSDAFSAEERAALAYVDCLILEGGRVPDETFAALQSHFSDERHLGADLSRADVQPARRSRAKRCAWNTTTWTNGFAKYRCRTRRRTPLIRAKRLEKTGAVVDHLAPIWTHRHVEDADHGWQTKHASSRFAASTTWRLPART